MSERRGRYSPRQIGPSSYLAFEKEIYRLRAERLRQSHPRNPQWTSASLPLQSPSPFSSFSNKRKYPPSPPSLPVVGHLHLFRKPLHRALSRISERYGPIVLLRFGSRPVLVVSSPSLAQECFTKNDVTFANRPRLPSVKNLSFDHTTIESASYGPRWRNLRRVTTVHLLSSHHLNLSAAARASQVRAFVRRLSQDSNANGYFKKVELKSGLFEFSLNNMMGMIAGKRSTSSEEVAKLMELMKEVSKLYGASSVGDFLTLLGWMDVEGVRKKEMKLAENRNGFLQGLIDEQKARCTDTEADARGKSMIEDLLALQKADPEYYTDRVIKGLISTMLIAGTETSSNTLEWAMTLLLNNPDKLKKLQAEIDQTIGNDRLIHESDISNLPYLQRVVVETLRLYPAGPLLVPHESSEECVVGGYGVPRGTMLLVNAYSIHRDLGTWMEPGKFEPERFQDLEGEGTKMLPFGMGRRRCPGEGLANRVVSLLVGAMMQCFDWERTGEELVDVSEGSGLTLPKVIPLEAMYRPRQAMKGVLLDDLMY